jgi:hypothetical protein
MKNRTDLSKKTIYINSTLKIVIFFFTIALISNLNAIVDAFLHPEIPYLDEEHLIVGGVAGIVTAALFGLIMLYAHHLEKTLSRIKALESFLPICSSCKKIKISGATDQSQQERWQPIDSYIRERTNIEFNHSLCPDCVKRLYPDFNR